MRKIIILPLILVLTVFTLGGEIRDYSEPDGKYLISALGFDKWGNEILLTANTVVVEQENRKSEIKQKNFTAQGKSIGEAYNFLLDKFANTVSFGHCGVFVLGETLDEQSIDAVFEYLYTVYDISFDAYLVFTENANSLLSLSPISSPVLGYDLMGLLKQRKEEWKLKYTSRIYEVEERRLLACPVFTLPYITGEDGSLKISGLEIFNQSNPIMRLDKNNGLLYAILKNSFSGGNVCVLSESTPYSAFIKYSYSTLKFEYKDGLNIKLSVKINSDDERKDEFCKVLKTELERFIRESIYTGEDIFALENKIMRNKEVYSKISGNYSEYLKNAKVEIIVY